MRLTIRNITSAETQSRVLRCLALRAQGAVGAIDGQSYREYESHPHAQGILELLRIQAHAPHAGNRIRDRSGTGARCWPRFRRCPGTRRSPDGKRGRRLVGTDAGRAGACHFCLVCFLVGLRRRGRQRPRADLQRQRMERAHRHRQHVWPLLYFVSVYLILRRRGQQRPRADLQRQHMEHTHVDRFVHSFPFVVVWLLVVLRSRGGGQRTDLQRQLVELSRRYRRHGRALLGFVCVLVVLRGRGPGGRCADLQRQLVELSHRYRRHGRALLGFVCVLVVLRWPWTWGAMR